MTSAEAAPFVGEIVVLTREFRDVRGNLLRTAQLGPARLVAVKGADLPISEQAWIVDTFATDGRKIGSSYIWPGDVVAARVVEVPERKTS